MYLRIASNYNNKVNCELEILPFEVTHNPVEKIQLKNEQIFGVLFTVANIYFPHICFSGRFTIISNDLFTYSLTSIYRTVIILNNLNINVWKIIWHYTTVLLFFL